MRDLAAVTRLETSTFVLNIKRVLPTSRAGGISDHSKRIIVCTRQCYIDYYAISVYVMSLDFKVFGH